MFYRAAKVLAAREWQKCLQHGVTTDLSAKVRNAFLVYPHQHIHHRHTYRNLL